MTYLNQPENQQLIPGSLLSHWMVFLSFPNPPNFKFLRKWTSVASNHLKEAIKKIYIKIVVWAKSTRNFGNEANGLVKTKHYLAKEKQLKLPEWD